MRQRKWKTFMNPIKFDRKLTFYEDISDLFEQASRKLNALAGIAPCINISKSQILMNAFFRSKIIYCPLIWICISHKNNGKMEKLY